MDSKDAAWYKTLLRFVVEIASLTFMVLSLRSWWPKRLFVWQRALVHFLGHLVIMRSKLKKFVFLNLDWLTGVEVNLNSINWAICNHYQKTRLLWQFFCNGCQKRSYMSPIATFFRTVAVHRVYCSVFWDCRYRYSLLQRPTVAGQKIAAIYKF